MDKCVICDKEAFADDADMCLSCAVNLPEFISNFPEEVHAELKAKANKVIKILESLAPKDDDYELDNLWDCANCGREYRLLDPSRMCSQCRTEHYG